MIRSILAALAAAAISFTPTAPAQAVGQPPSPPLSVVATAGESAAGVEWKEPESPGDGPIIGYEVASDPGAWTCKTDGALHCDVEGLTNGTAYTFTVTASNEFGTSEPSKPSDPVTPYTVPDAPALSFVSAGDTYLLAYWTAPAFNGGSAIIDYTATAMPGGRTCTTAAGNCPIDGLTNGVEYTVTVTARNARGSSAPSNPLSRTPYTSPGPPTAVVAAPIENGAEVTWIPPVDDGGLPIAYYFVETENAERDCVSTTTSCTLTGLVAGRTYRIRVQAVNQGNRWSSQALSDPLDIVGGAAGPGDGAALVAWGADYQAGLGDGLVSFPVSPTPVPAYLAVGLNAPYFTAVDAIMDSACAADGSGRGYTWGTGSFPDGSTTASIPVLQPDLPQPASQVVTGYVFGCVLKEGLAYCWGRTALGNGSWTAQRNPVPVATDGALSGKYLVQISAGTRHACALDSDGLAYCWGEDALGSATHLSAVPIPVDTDGVLAGKRLVQISASHSHTCAADSDGVAYCWGYGALGQLGNGQFASSDVPVVVGPVAHAGLDAGPGHTCAVDSQGVARCWGFNDLGQLGDGGTTSSATPVVVAGSHTWASITAGSSHTCGVETSGAAYCWGSGNSGELGDGQGTNSTVPVPVETSGVLAGRAIVDIAAAGSFTIALAASVPDPPASVTATAADGRAAIAWQAPADHGGAIDKYRVGAQPGGAVCETSGTSCDITGLTNGTTYVFTATAHNLAGWGPGATSNAVTPVAAVTPQAAVVAPGKVRGLKAKVLPKKVRVTWKATTGATGYRYRVRKPHKRYGSWHSTSSRRLTIRHLKKGPYRVQVRALNSAGAGPEATLKFKVRS